ncbi:MAG: serpin family protein [Planctomycetota bacterium]|jgi:serpin B
MKRHLVFAVTVVWALTTSQARLRGMSLEEMVRFKPVAVVGKITRVEHGDPAEHNGRQYDIGYINVKRVLKNKLADRQIKPGDEIGLLLRSSLSERHRSPGPPDFEEGTEKIWLLSYSGYSDGTFSSMHPVSFQPVSKEAEIAALVQTIEADTRSLVAGNTDFALEMYSELAGAEQGNLFFSPYSISTALGMTYAGARGETEKQMAEVLGFGLPQERLHKTLGALEKQLNRGGNKGGYEMNVANALWGQKDYHFLDEFLDLTRRNYGAGLQSVDFVNATEEARQTINGWVEEKTKQKIKQLIARGVLNRLTTLVLTNAIYFKGDWASKFEEENTKLAPFHVVRYQAGDNNPGDASGEKAVLTDLEQRMQKRVTVDFRELPIEDVLRIMSEQADIDIVMSPKVTGTVTAKLTDVPTEEVLRNILAAYGYRYVVDKNVIRVEPAEGIAETVVSTVQAAMMYQEGRFKYGRTQDLQILELPYKGNDLSMVVLLPKEVDGLAELERSLTRENLKRWLRDLHDREVRVYLPKFKITTGPVELKNILAQMGMPAAFSDADFSGMTGKRELFISHVLHKAFVEVNEEGTEAAAATAVVMRKRIGIVATPVFRADHPFVFMIRHNPTGSVLFVGRVASPGQTAVSHVSENKLPQDKNGNLILYVANQSFAIDPVDIKVYIDDKLAIDREFDVGTGKRRQHNWQKFQFQLSEGAHRLRVESKKGQASFEEQFEVRDKHWAVLDYWFGGREDSPPAQKKFTFQVSDEPIYFE